MNKKYTEKTAAACCRRLLKSAGKVAGDLAHGWTDSKGRQCFSDGYRAYILNRPLQGLPTEDKHRAAAPLEKIFSALDGGDVITIPAPDADALKAFQDAGKGEPWSLGEDLPTVDPEYIADALRLFPGAVWYVHADPLKRLTSPLFLIHDEGAACVFPIYDAAKIRRVKAARQPAEERPETGSKAAEPADKPAPSWPADLKYFIYAKLPGDKSFALADPAHGKYKLGKFYAPRFAEKDLERLQEFLDLAAATIPGAVFQVRRLDGRRTVYTAQPTFTPELFAETYAA